MLDYEKIFLERGFVKNKKQFIMEYPESFLCIEIQKSVFSKCNFLNFGIFFKNIFGTSSKKPLSSDKWHLYGRYNMFIESQKPEDVFIAQGIEENYLPEFEKKLLTNIDTIVLPFLSLFVNKGLVYENLDKINSNKIWLQNISTQDLTVWCRG